MRRKFTLALSIAFLAISSIVNFGCSRPGPANADESYDLDKEEKVNFDLNDPKIRERLGEDDRFAFAILYGADIHGSLETCG